MEPRHHRIESLVLSFDFLIMVAASPSTATLRFGYSLHIPTECTNKHLFTPRFHLARTNNSVAGLLVGLILLLLLSELQG